MKSSSKSLIHGTVLPEAVSRKNFTHMHDNTCKSFTQQNYVREPSYPCELSYKVLQAAKNEKVELIPNFSASENSAS